MGLGSSLPFKPLLGKPLELLPPLNAGDMLLGSPVMRPGLAELLVIELLRDSDD